MYWPVPSVAPLTQWCCQEPAARAGPKERAGLMEQPVYGTCSRCHLVQITSKCHLVQITSRCLHSNTVDACTGNERRAPTKSGELPGKVPETDARKIYVSGVNMSSAIFFIKLLKREKNTYNSTIYSGTQSEIFITPNPHIHTLTNNNNINTHIGLWCSFKIFYCNRDYC